MPAATIEQSSNDTTPVFVAGGRHRNHAVRLAAAILGVLLVGWLAALAAGLIGFSPLPELTLPGTGSVQTAPAPPDQGAQPARVRDAMAHASPIASRQATGDDKVRAAGSGAPDAPGSAPDASRSGTGGATGLAGSGGGGTGSTSPVSGGGAPPSQTTSPSGGAGSPASPGNPPSFTPPASGAKSANPPRGNSANAPGRTISADPPGKATRTRPNSG